MTHLLDILEPELLRLGAVKIEDYYCPCYVIETIAGTLSIYPGNRERVKPHGRKWLVSCIHSRFDEADAARELVGHDVSRAGKWNFYAGEATEKGDQFLAEYYVVQLSMITKGSEDECRRSAWPQTDAGETHE